MWERRKEEEKEEEEEQIGEGSMFCFFDTANTSRKIVRAAYARKQLSELPLAGPCLVGGTSGLTLSNGRAHILLPSVVPSGFSRVAVRR